MSESGKRRYSVAFEMGFLLGKESTQVFYHVRRLRPKARKLWPRNYRARSRRK